MTTDTGCSMSVEVFTGSERIPAATEDDLRALSDVPMVARLDRPAPWLDGALDAIDRVATLGKNWDSYDANAVDYESVACARKLTQCLADFVNVGAPVVTAAPQGEVAFCWDTGDWSLDASVDRTGLISYVFLDERDASQEREGRTRDVHDLVALITRW